MHGLTHKAWIFLSLLAFFPLPAPAWSGDYLYVTNSDANLLSVIDEEKGVVVQEVPVGAEPYDVAIDAEGRWVAISHEQRRGEVWFLDRKTLQVRHRVLLVEEKEKKVNGFFIVFSKDGRRLYAVNQFSSLLFVVDTIAGTIIERIRLGEKIGQIRWIVLSPDGRNLYLPDMNNGKILVVDTATGVIQDPIKIDGSPSAVAISPDGGILYVANAENASLDILDMKTKGLKKRIPVGKAPAGISISKDGKSIFVSNMLSYNVTAIDSEHKEAVANIPVGAYPIGIVVSPDGERVYVCNYNENSVSIIDTRTYKEVVRVPTASTPVKIAIYHSPGKK